VTPEQTGKIDEEATRLTIARFGHTLPDNSFAGLVLPTLGCAMLLIIFSHLAGVRERTGLLIDSLTLLFGIGYYLVQRSRARSWLNYYREVFDRLWREASN
jgi:multisubunit Na+/H+ antiporter MnhB subunit